MLFKLTDIDTVPGGHVSPHSATASAAAIKPARFITEERLDLIEKTIGAIAPGESIFFKTEGAWSNIHLLEFILMISGPADVYLTTWSISADAIARFSEWQNHGAIKQLFVVLDAGIRNRKPEIYQQATGAFKTLKVTHCHAKVTVISNQEYQVTIIGSANYTRNPRIETGMIIRDKALADENAKWILEEIYK